MTAVFRRPQRTRLWWAFILQCLSLPLKMRYLFNPLVCFYLLNDVWWDRHLPFWLSVLGVECPCFHRVTLSLPSPCRLKQPTCCFINAEMRKPPPNLSLRPHWEVPLRQQKTTWTQTEEPRCEGHTLKRIRQIETLGRTHKATLVTEDSTDFNIINPHLPLILFDFVSYVVN